MRIASLIVLLAIIATLITLGTYFAVKLLTRRGASPSGGSMTVGVSTNIAEGQDTVSNSDKPTSQAGAGTVHDLPQGGNAVNADTVSGGTSANISVTGSQIGGKTAKTPSSTVGGTASDGKTSSVTSTSASSNPGLSGSDSSSSGSSGTGSSTSGASSQSQTPEVNEPWLTRNVEGGVEITGIGETVSSGNYTIPSQINGKTVIGIGNRAFYYESGVKQITLPETLTYIGEQAFANADGLTSVVIPSRVISIKSNAFVECTYLADIYIKSENISIDSNAFSTVYQRNVTLTIHAPSDVMNSIQARMLCDAEYEEWNG